MGKRVTMQDIADKLGVTKMSVSKAINGQRGIGDELRQKILETALSMGYIINAKLQAQKVYTFAFVVTKRFFLETDRFYNIIYYHLNKQCIGLGHKLVLIVLNEAEENLKVPLQSLCKDVPDGIFLAGHISNDYIDDLMRRENVPVIALDFYRDDIDSDFVLADNYQLGYQATMKMINYGHRHIGFVGRVFSTSSITDRFFGYVKALAANGLPIRDDWFIVNNDSNTGYYSTDIAMPDDMPTGFVCHCEMAAYFLKKTLEQMGLRIPEDVSVVAFDNTEIGRTTMHNLTTFNIGRHEIADTALKLMLKRLSGDNSLIGKHYVQSFFVEGTTVYDRRGESATNTQ